MIWLTKIIEHLGNQKHKAVTYESNKIGLLLIALGVGAAIFHVDTWVILSLFIAGGIFLILGLILTIYFVKKDPSYLRSESYQIQSKSIEMLGDKNNFHNPNIKDITKIASPFVSGTDDKRMLE